MRPLVCPFRCVFTPAGRCSERSNLAVLNDLSLAAAVFGGLIVAAGAAAVLVGLRRGTPLLVAGVAVLAIGAGLAISDRAFAPAPAAPKATAVPASAAIRPRAAAVLSTAARSTAGTAPAVHATTASEIQFVDVGQGDGVVMRIGGKVIVSDAGQFNVQSVDAALRAIGAKAIDFAILSHPHSDHVKNFIALVKTDGWKIHTAVLSHSAYWTKTATNRGVISDLQSSGTTLEYVAAGDELSLGKAKIEILNPPAGKYAGPLDAPNSSVVYALRYGKLTALFTGDIGPKVAKAVAATWKQRRFPRAVIFLATHHGSAQGSTPDLLAAIKPKWAILSTGSNEFGHPTVAAIKRLEASGASIWCTDANGTITARLASNGSITWLASKQPIPWWSAATKTETGKCVGR
jgi:beta-lactamase superfamily II metal-dependent hydrolase